MKRSCVYLSSIIGIILGGLGVVGATSALEYQSNPVDIKFEFGSTLTFSSPGDIIISNLVPGTKAISDDDYKVTVSTNNLTGYTLYATVGCASGTNCNDSKNLTDGTNNFTMVSSTGALTAGMWGVSLDDNATENSNFMTLAKYDDLAATIINQTTNNTGTPATGYAGTSDTTVRIGAYATASQVAGTYVNKINFIPIANMTTNCGNYNADYCMQDVGNWIGGLSAGQEVQATDARDGKVYYAMKMTNGHMLMTQNLDHDIVTDGSVVYDSTTTDIPSAWIPSTATTTPTTFIVWYSDDTYSNLPQSYSPGDKYWNGTMDSNWDFDGRLDNTKYISTTGDAHHHVGNYYDWTAAVAMNDSSSYTADGTDVDQSICPAGWTLPTETSVSGKVSWNDIYTAYSSVTWYNSPLYFTLAGSWDGSSGGIGLYSFCWSREVKSPYYAHFSYADLDGGVYSNYDDRFYGRSVRCISR